MNVPARTADPRDRLVIALDFPSAKAALAMDERLGEEVVWVKVGLELFTAAGPAVVAALKQRGRRVFLDLKLHDIPNTVAGGVRAAAEHGVDWLTLHTSGGPAMMEAAREAREKAGSSLALLGVTVLTSLDGSEFPGLYRSTDVGRRVEQLAAAALEAGLDGLVASPREVASLRERVPASFHRVTPGIRPAGLGADDQARTATPHAALTGGATHLVVGRPVTRASDPRAAVVALLSEMAEALR